MSDDTAGRPPANPFSTCNVRPGAIAFLFSPGESAAQLVERLQASGWRGEIVGPHGSGKSALVAALVPHLAAVGRRVISIALHDRQRNLRAFAGDLATVDAATLIVVDGYEQLSWLSRVRLARLCRKRRCGLLVTSHAPFGLPRLYETRPTLDAALRIVGTLVNLDGGEIGRDDVARLFAAREGNLRDVLFDLYDLYEMRRRKEA